MRSSLARHDVKRPRPKLAAMTGGAPKVKLTPEQEEQIRQKLRGGISKDEIKRELGTDGRVLNRLEREVKSRQPTSVFAWAEPPVGSRRWAI
jgi:DNA invertase Pin-like site-specific DNA recombinase